MIKVHSQSNKISEKICHNQKILNRDLNLSCIMHSTRILTKYRIKSNNNDYKEARWYQWIIKTILSEISQDKIELSGIHFFQNFWKNSSFKDLLTSNPEHNPWEIFIRTRGIFTTIKLVLYVWSLSHYWMSTPLRIIHL
jgi:hypothetical protein